MMRPHSAGGAVLGGSANGSRTATLPLAKPTYSPLVSVRPQGFLNGAYRVYMEVREFETDMYGVVSNAVYPQYLMHGRIKTLAELGWDASRLANEHDTLTATVEQTIKYRAPLRPGDAFYVQTAYTKVGACTFAFSDRIVRLRGGAGAWGGATAAPLVALEAVAVCSFLDRAFKPKRPPQALKEAMTAQCAAYTAWAAACGGEDNLPLL